MINHIGPSPLIPYDSIGENNKMSGHNTCMFADPENGVSGIKKQRKKKEKKTKKEMKKKNNFGRFSHSFLLPLI